MMISGAVIRGVDTTEKGAWEKFIEDFKTKQAHGKFLAWRSEPEVTVEINFDDHIATCQVRARVFISANPLRGVKKASFIYGGNQYGELVR